jgi:hypothetical protein
MNKTVMFVTFAVLAGLGIIGSAFLLVYRPDASATFGTQTVLFLGLVTSAAGTFALLDKQGKKIEQIQEQTNGNLSRRDEEIVLLREQLTQNGITPVPGPATIVGRHTKDTT